MPHRIQFLLSDEQYKVFLKDVERSGLSISQYVTSKVLPKNSDFDSIWKEFSDNLAHFPNNIEFDVSIVMGRERWTSLSKSQKLSVARLFNKKVSAREYDNIVLVGRSSSNVSRYKKNS